MRLIHYSIAPVHPGEILSEDFLRVYGLTAGKLAKAMKCPRARIYKLTYGWISITADTALRLGRVFGTTPDFWLTLQSNYDLAKAAPLIADELDLIVPMSIELGREPL